MEQHRLGSCYYEGYGHEDGKVVQQTQNRMVLDWTKRKAKIMALVNNKVKFGAFQKKIYKIRMVSNFLVAR